MKGKKLTIYNLSAIGLMTAVCFVSNYLQIPFGSSRIHFGNVFCLLSGLLFGPLTGGLASGFGAFFYDLTFPLYIATSPFTLVFKFLMGFTAGAIAHGGGAAGRRRGRNLVGAVSGAFLYILLYVGRNFLNELWFNKSALQAALILAGEKLVASSINAALAITVAMILAPLFRTALEKAGIYRKIMG